MLGLTHLETAVLNAICEYNGECGKALRALLPGMSVKNRENTGGGFYTDLNVDRSQPPVPSETGEMDEPVAHMSNMGDSMIMGFALHFEDGYPGCLEGFLYGDVDLKERDLAALEFIRLEPHPK